MNKRIKFLLTSLVMIIGIGINVTNNCYCMLPDTDNKINVMQNINNNINDVLEYYYIHNIKSYNDFLNNCNIINGGVLQSIYPSYITQDHIRPTILGLIRYCSNISDKIGSYLHDVFPNNDDYEKEANKSINIKLLNDIVGNTYIKDKKSVTFQQFLNYLSNKICFVVMQCIYNIENLIKSNKNIDWEVIKDEINLCYKNVTNILDKLKAIPFGKQLIDAVYQDDNVKVWNKRIIEVMQNINDNNINVNIMQNKNNNTNNNVNNNINVIHNKNNSVNVMQNKNNNINDILKYYNINIKDYNNLLDNCDFIREHIQNICSNLSQYIKQVNIKQTIRDLTMYCSNISDKIGSCLHEVFPNNEICKTVANKSINITLLNNIVGNTYIKDKEVVTFQQFLNYLSNKICLVVMQCAYNIENLIKNKNIDEKVIKNEIKLCCENVTNILDILKTIPFGKQLIDVILYYDN